MNVRQCVTMNLEDDLVKVIRKMRNVNFCMQPLDSNEQQRVLISIKTNLHCGAASDL